MSDIHCDFSLDLNLSAFLRQDIIEGIAGHDVLQCRLGAPKIVFNC